MLVCFFSDDGHAPPPDGDQAPCRSWPSGSAHRECVCFQENQKLRSTCVCVYKFRMDRRVVALKACSRGCWPPNRPLWVAELSRRDNGTRVRVRLRISPVQMVCFLLAGSSKLGLRRQCARWGMYILYTESGEPFVFFVFFHDELRLAPLSSTLNSTHIIRTSTGLSLPYPILRSYALRRPHQRRRQHFVYVRCRADRIPWALRPAHHVRQPVGAGSHGQELRRSDQGAEDREDGGRPHGAGDKTGLAAGRGASGAFVD